MIYAMWFGGCGYSAGDMVKDLESFPSLAAAKAALDDRRRNGYSFFQRFELVNRDAESVLCPCIEDDSCMWCWKAADVVDGATHVPDYPDWVLEFGPRGGILVTTG